jgi:pyruvate,water dikinase
VRAIRKEGACFISIAGAERPATDSLAPARRRVYQDDVMLELPDAPDILPLEACGREAIAIVGGKAANLGELMRGGFPVPPGFTVTTRAYARVAEAAGIERVLAAIEGARAEDRAALSALAAEARAAIAAAPVDSSLLEGDLAAAYAALGEGAVAVRSSATAEDLEFASFAGQQDTYLNVVGADAVRDAVRRCWASLWNERAVLYRAQQRVGARGVRLAVVVQRLVDARVAGVLFSANPLTGRRREAVIDASLGLGEAIVAGAVNPDHFVVDTGRRRILERRLGDKQVAIRPAASGGVERVTGAGAEGGACLGDEQVLALAALGAGVEARYGAPQDLEFAVDASGKIWLTQARPITTLFPLPEGAPASDDDLRVYASATADEGVTRPITPMGLQAFRLLVSAWAELFWGARPADPARGPAIVAEAALRMYYDITPLVRSALARRALTTLMSWADEHTAGLLRALAGDPRLEPSPTPLWAAARAVLTPIARSHAPSRIARALLDPAWSRRAAAPALAAAAALGDAPASAPPAERLDRAERLLLDGAGALPLTWIAPAAGGLAFLAAERLLGARAAPDELQVAMRGLPGNPTTEMNLALWDVAVQVRADPASARAVIDGEPAALARRFREGSLPAPLQRGLARFLERHGHRGVAEVDLGLPRWRDDPTHLFGVLQNYLRADDERAAPDAQFRRATREAEAKAAELARRAGPARRALVRLLLGRARGLSGAREAWKDELTRQLALARALLVPVGEALARDGRLDDAEDIFFVSLAEAREGVAGADLRPRVRERRAQYRRELGRRRVPSVLLSDGTEPALAPAETASDDPRVLRGTPASPGKVRGKARVLFDPTGARLEPGEVLVAPSTDPGWTALFLTAGGLVMERGGAVSHGAVIAREYGIPAVVGVPGATSRITSGQEIEVDGAAGRVVLGLAERGRT